ncbi:unnamed protein product [Schistosoma mattheei]|uniref:Uncharacterized protein n=1 Tax=Schistosoma mattheei TaxID=31246 RepID=A0A183Q216_9TREM|nr:unnamed protein product [Schistosoma mattheei]
MMYKKLQKKNDNGFGNKNVYIHRVVIVIINDANIVKKEFRKEGD